MVIAADKTDYQVKFISPTGVVTKVIGDGRPGRGPNRFRTPEGVETQGDRLWISDSGNDRVVLYRFGLE
jgi:hypothetical protein